MQLQLLLVIIFINIFYLCDKLICLRNYFNLVKNQFLINILFN